MGRRRKGEPPAYRPHKSSGQAYSTFNYETTYHGVFGTEESRKNYAAYLREWEQVQGQVYNRPKLDGSCTVAALCTAFILHARTHYVRVDGTLTDEFNAFKNAFRPLLRLFRSLEVHDFKPRHLKEIREFWRQEKHTRSTINKNTGRIIRAFKWGVGEELVDPLIVGALTAIQPLQAGQALVPDPEQVPPVDDAVVDATLPFLPRQIRAMVELQRATGMRPGEVCRMRGCEIDQAGRVQLPRGRTVIVPGWVFCPSQHKGRRRKGSARYLSYILGPNARSILAQWLRSDSSEFLFQPAEAVNERRIALRESRRSKVTPSQSNRRKKYPRRRPGSFYTPASYGRAIRTAAAKAGVPHWHPNQLRHAWVTRVVPLEGIERTSEAIGHSATSTTELYLERRARAAAEVAAKHG